jgi:hypothetical protein
LVFLHRNHGSLLRSRSAPLRLPGRRRLRPSQPGELQSAAFNGPKLIHLFQEIEEEIENPSTTPALAVTVEATFPDAEIFGIKITNGKPYESRLSFLNEEPDPVTVQFVGGSLWTFDTGAANQSPRIVRNLTTAQYAIEIPPGEKQTLPYRFQTNLHPQDLRLNLAAVVSVQNTFHTLNAFNGTVSVVEPDASIFDPQL